MTVPVHGLPSLVREGQMVAVVPPELTGERWHKVTSCSQDNRAGTLVGLSDVSNLDGAESLVGRYLLARRADLPDDLELHDAAALIGREVTDCSLGLSGVLTEVMCGPANDVWVIVATLACNDFELLLPVIDSVVSVVPDEGPINVNASGFVDISEGDDENR